VDDTTTALEVEQKVVRAICKGLTGVTSQGVRDHYQQSRLTAVTPDNHSWVLDPSDIPWAIHNSKKNVTFQLKVSVSADKSRKDIPEARKSDPIIDAIRSSNSSALKKVRGDGV
jgi:hypothetical protein